MRWLFCTCFISAFGAFSVISPVDKAVLDSSDVKIAVSFSRRVANVCLRSAVDLYCEEGNPIEWSEPTCFAPKALFFEAATKYGAVCNRLSVAVEGEERVVSFRV